MSGQFFMILCPTPQPIRYRRQGRSDVVNELEFFEAISYFHKAEHRAGI